MTQDNDNNQAGEIGEEQEIRRGSLKFFRGIDLGGDGCPWGIKSGVGEDKGKPKDRG